ncbi:MAG: hypothetical protein OXI87_07940 [Albidovulum sp.]|nr:hypothetical protein [Albidovulum sp.]MDE0534583.1 hypothetical protein [Albidovulum sp.]
MKRTARPPAYIPRPHAIATAPKDYRQSKAELGEEFELPGIDDEESRRRFVRPIRVAHHAPDSE